MSTLAHSGVAVSPVPLLTGPFVPRPDRGVRRGELVRVTRGVYAPAELWRELAPWDRYLTRVHAAAIVYPDAVFILESAAALRGLPVFAEPSQVHVILPEPATARVFSGTRIHTRRRMPHVDTLAGMQVATGSETAVEIARLRHPAVALAVAGAALRQDPMVTAESLAELSAEQASSRGRRSARWVFERATAVPESPLENVSLAVIEWLGFELPEMQAWIRGSQPGEDDRVDFLWPSQSIAGEADGAIKYSGAMGDAREALRARNARDARLMRRGIAAVAHWGWPDLIAPQQLRAILQAAGIRPIRAEQTAPLYTLAAALRSRAR